MTEMPRFRALDLFLFLVIVTAAAGLRAGYLHSCADDARTSGALLVQGEDIDHAVALLAQYADACLLAGGQSLIATLNMRLSAPRLLIDLNALDELKRISRDGDTLSIVPSIAGGSVAAPPEEETASLSKDEILRYSRHLIMPEVGTDGQLKLKAAKALGLTIPESFLVRADAVIE